MLGAACAATGVRRASIDEMAPIVMHAPASRVCDAIAKSLFETGYRVDELHASPDGGCFGAAIYGASATGWGHILRVDVRPDGLERSQLRLFAKRKMPMNLTEPDRARETEIVARLRCAIEYACTVNP